MNRTIWKFSEPVAGEYLLAMPADSRILAVQAQNERFALWAEVNPVKPSVARRILAVGTGHGLPGQGSYIGTVQYAEGTLVLHYYDLGET